jgi:hypothetical protein
VSHFKILVSENPPFRVAAIPQPFSFQHGPVRALLFTEGKSHSMNDPATYWLNFTNFALLGLVVICCGAVAFGVVQELAARRKKAASMSKLDREVSDLVASYDGHSFHVPGLGLTMADGGEETEKKEEER